MKKYLFMMITFLVSLISFQQCNAGNGYNNLWDGAVFDHNFYYSNNETIQTMQQTPNGETGSENLGVMFWNGMTYGVDQNGMNSQSLVASFLEIFGFNTDDYQGKMPKAIIYAKSIINLLLSLLSFVALIILIYTFYLMFFSEDGKWFDKVKSNLKGLLLWFVFLWLSWIIVSFIFNFYEKKILQDNAEITMESDNKI